MRAITDLARTDNHHLRTTIYELPSTIYHLPSSGKLDDAVRAFRSAAALAPADAEVQANLARALQILQQQGR